MTASMRHRMLAGTAVAVLGVTVSAVPGHAAGPKAAPRTVAPRAATSAPVVVVYGLNNPRQLSLGRGVLLIAEAGRGGPKRIAAPQGPAYLGRTASISAVVHPIGVANHRPNRIVTGLLSIAGQDGSGAVGADGVSRRKNVVYIAETSGWTLTAHPYRSARYFANLKHFETAYDPDGQGADSNPYAVLVRPHDVLVADAAGNDILRLDARGNVTVWKRFANIRTRGCASLNDPGPKFPGCNFVPTALARDAQGNVYVSGLAGEEPHAGRVVKLRWDGTGPALHTYGNFNSPTGVAVDGRGNLYVSELTGVETHPVGARVTGVVTKVLPNRTRVHLDVPFPAGLASDGYGNLYVAAWSIAPASGLSGQGTSGQVWRLRF